MDRRARRAQAAYLVALDLIPLDRDNSRPIPNDPKARFLRALEYLVYTDKEPTISKAATAAGIPRGTVASWRSRRAAFDKQVTEMLERAELEYQEVDSIQDLEDQARAERIEQLPELERARVAVGDVPSRRFMETVWPPESTDWADEHPNWLRPFPGDDRNQEAS